MCDKAANQDILAECLEMSQFGYLLPVQMST